MPNAIKYNVSAETLALKKGNFWIGTGDVGKGPTSSTGFYNGITPPTGGFTIYLNKSSGGPSIYTVTTEAQMVSLTNSIGSQNFTTSGQCLNWFATQTDKMIFNRDYEGIITNGLVMNLDAGFTPSYPTTATTWYDVSSGGNNGTLINSPSYSSNNGGTLRFDGVDDRVLVSSQTTSPFSFGTGPFTISFWYRNIDWSGYQNFWSSGAGSNGGQGVVGIRYSNNTYPYYYYANGFQIVDYNSQTMNVWYYSTLVGNGGSDGNRNIKLYLNGNQVGSTYTNNYNFSDGRFLIGANESSLGGTEGTNGNISQFSIYNRALSNSEILQNFNALKGRYGL